MNSRMSVSISDHVADVRLARPQKLNALDAAMFEGLIETGRELAGHKDLRAVVLSGEGKAFCAGLDFMSFMSGPKDQGTTSLLKRDSSSLANRAQAAAYVWKELPVPVIAAIHGVAYGGGLQIAAAADIRFVTPDAKLSIREMYWGLIPDMSGTRTFRDLLPLDVLKELVYTARIITGVEAHELGLATHVVDDPFDAAMHLAQEIASKSPNAVRSAKRLLDQAYRLDEAEGLLLEEKEQRSLLGSPNQIEAVTANLEKRDPNFRESE
jgi:enoyl-CoA hydratase/carnithine racemase